MSTLEPIAMPEKVTPDMEQTTEGPQARPQEEVTRG